jgi:scyllo-inositol 2-dehydrogenase (NADP+)
MALRATLLGFGLAGRVFHAPLMRAAGIEVAHVATSRTREAAAALPGARVHADPTAALAADADLVVVATPNTTHVPLAAAAIEAGRHVVVDKPVAPSAAEADGLIALAAARGRMLTVFQNRRRDSDCLTVRRALADGALGAPTLYEAHFDRWRPSATGRWRERPEPGGGLLFDLGVHLIDQALQLFGPPDWISADLAAQRPGGETDDAFEVLMASGRLRIRLAASSFAASPRPRFRVSGERGTLEIRQPDVQEDRLRAGRDPGDPGFGAPPPGGAVLTDGGGRTTEIDAAPGDWAWFYAAVRRAVEDGGPPPVDPAGARDAVALVEAAMRSSREGRRIDRPLGGPSAALPLAGGDGAVMVGGRPIPPATGPETAG